jgi:hypothetical protein
MTPPKHEPFLFEILDKAVTKYRTESKRLKRLTYFFKIAVLFLSAGSTVLLGLNVTSVPNYPIWSRNIVLGMGALSTFLIGLSAFWNVESYWLKQKVLYARLRAIQEHCKYLQAEQDKLSPEQIQAAFGEYRQLMDERIEYWEKISEKTASPEAEAKKT